MKDREYFEYLVSLELDNDLSPEQKEDLEQQLSRDSRLRTYRADLRSQQQVIRSLPTLGSTGSMDVTPARPQSGSVLGRLWAIRLNQPAPVAAAAAIILFIGGMFITRTEIQLARPAVPASAESGPILFQSEKLEPASARLVTEQDISIE